jgi:hypothetical protein
MTPEERATRANAMARELQLRSSRPANLAEWDAIAIAIVLTEINAAIAEEREACAKVAEDLEPASGGYYESHGDIAAAIRARR